MSGLRVYLDHNATAPLRPQARSAMVAALDVANPSSVHRDGQRARALVEDAREQVARRFGAKASQVVFTSGATEAAALALAPVERDGRTERLLVGATEHACILGGGRFGAAQITRLGVTADGLIDVNALDEALRESAAAGERPVLALQLANNETGVIQPVAEASARVRAFGGRVICDAVQGAGRLTIDRDQLGADALIISSHKLGGPQGAGALIVREPWLASPLIRGGGQERGLRAGTENVPAIAGFGAACAALDPVDEAARIEALRDALWQGLVAISPQMITFGACAPRLCNTMCVGVPGHSANTALIALDLAGISVSSGSACSSGKVGPSHVLAAMGVAPNLAKCALRFSLGWTTTQDDVTEALAAWTGATDALPRVQRVAVA